MSRESRFRFSRVRKTIRLRVDDHHEYDAPALNVLSCRLVVLDRSQIGVTLLVNNSLVRIAAVALNPSEILQLHPTVTKYWSRRLLI